MRIFSKFFGDVQTKEPDGELPEFEPRNVEFPMADLIISQEKVLTLLKNLKVGKSPGPDNFAPRLLKELADVIDRPVTLIYSKSVTAGAPPESWLNAHISVIFKKGKKSLAGNYRPISLTPILCKLLETIIRDHIMIHMKQNKLFSDKQFGFLPGRSTTLQLLRAIDDWTSAIENGHYTECIYTDFRKAFDTVPHRRLMKNIKAYGIAPNICQWIENWITGRKQKVIINGVESEWADVISGVPQGSVLGPLLFVIFINDLPELVVAVLLLYADDSKIYKEITSRQDLESLQSDLDSISMWSDKWLLRFAPDKLKSLTITDRPQQVQAFHVGPYAVGKSVCEKDLGVHVDSGLTFGEHIVTKVKTANKIVGGIRRSFRYLDHSTFSLLFKALVRCHLETSVAVWSPASERHIDLMEGVQRRATKMLPDMSHFDYPERLKKLRLPTLKYRRCRGNMIETFKIIKEKYDKDVSPKLVMRNSINQRSTTRGHQYTLFQGRSVKEVRRRSFTQRVIPIWNSLPSKVVEAEMTDTFKVRLDKHWKFQPMLVDPKAILTSVRHKGVIVLRTER